MKPGAVGLQGGVMGLDVSGPTGTLHHSEPVDAGNVFTLRPGERFDASLMRVNTSKQKLYENIRINVARMIPQLRPYEENAAPVALVGGGWSLAEPGVFEELRQLWFAGTKLVAINGAARWLMERNLRPSAHVVLDARPENVEFVREPIPNCALFLASQCDPSLFDAVGDERDVTIFHALAHDSCVVESAILNAHYGTGHWLHVPACSSAGVTAILICRILGYRFQHLFGIDSCYRDEQTHHAYPQSLNDNERPAYFRVGGEGRAFLCSPWQAAQARSFMDMVSRNHQLLELEIHGDGLLAYMLKTASEMPANPEN